MNTNALLNNECKVCYTTTTNLISVCECAGSVGYLCRDCFISILNSQSSEHARVYKVDTSTTPIIVYLNVDSDHVFPSYFKCKDCDSYYNVTYNCRIIVPTDYISPCILMLEVANIFFLCLVFIDKFRRETLMSTISIIVYMLNICIYISYINRNTREFINNAFRCCNINFTKAVMAFKFIGIILIPSSYAGCIIFGFVNYKYLLSYNPVAFLMGIYWFIVLIGWVIYIAGLYTVKLAKLCILLNNH
jgi:hypothetical protein